MKADPQPLHAARAIADALLAELAPACERVELAGSLRRQRAFVRDIEVVAVPRLREEAAPPAGQADLFAPPRPPVLVNALWERIEEVSDDHLSIVPIKPGVPGVEADDRWAEKRVAGSRYLKLWLPRTRLQVDLFLADRETWGVVLAVRTGSADFSRALVTRWTEVSGGGHSRGGRLRDARGRPVPTPEEEDVFRACRARWVPPERREGPRDLRGP